MNKKVKCSKCGKRFSWDTKNNLSNNGAYIMETVKGKIKESYLCEKCAKKEVDKTMTEYNKFFDQIKKKYLKPFMLFDLDEKPVKKKTIKKSIKKEKKNDKSRKNKKHVRK